MERFLFNENKRYLRYSKKKPRLKKKKKGGKCERQRKIKE
jgi:hypothetical protein